MDYEFIKNKEKLILDIYLKLTGLSENVTSIKNHKTKNIW